MAITNVTPRHVREALGLTGRIIDAYGPRLAGTEACRRSAGVLETEMARHCDRAGIEEFDVRPGAFLGFIKAATLAFLVSTLFLFSGYVVPAALGYTFAIVITLTQFVFYLRVFDPFYPKRKGYNVYGIIEPKGEVRRQVVISGHHDSAQVFNFFTSFPRLYRIRIILGFFPLVAAFVLAWAWIAMEYGAGAPPPFADAFRYGALVSLVFVIPMYFFAASRGTPGAGDNLIASAMAVTLAEIFGRKGKKGAPALAHTRLVLVSFDAEEAGLRGARAYVARHREELLAIPTFNLNIDGIYDADKIKFIISDINGFLGLSRAMAEECLGVTRRLGYRAKLLRFPFGAGGTDAAEFARAGVEATTLLAMPVSVERDVLVYHTEGDTVESVQPGAVEAVLNIARAYVLEKDGQAGGKSPAPGKKGNHAMKSRRRK